MALCPHHSAPFCGSRSNAVQGILHHHLQHGLQALHCKFPAAAPTLPWLASTLSVGRIQEISTANRKLKFTRLGHTAVAHGIARASSSLASGLALAPTTEEAEGLEAELPIEFPVESPASWSKAERALVERTLDLEGLHPTPSRRAELVKQAAAGAEIGFFYIKNFGAYLGLVDDVRREAYRFFAQPVQEKAKAATQLPVSDRTYGYSFDFGGVFTASATEGVAQPRFREMHRLRLFPESTRLEKAWPPAMPSFKDKLIRYSYPQSLAELSAHLHIHIYA